MKLKIQSFLFILIGLFWFGKSFSQTVSIPHEYLFFSRDTLNGFDWKGALGSHEAKGLKGERLLRYIHIKERQFVVDKYNLSMLEESDNTPTPKYDAAFASVCNNADFETGDFTNWTGFVGQNANSTKALKSIVAGIAPNQGATNAAESSCNWFTLCTAASPVDPYGSFPMLDPGGGKYACRIGGESANAGCNYSNGGFPADGVGELIQQAYTVTSANSLFTFRYAVCLCDGGHTLTEAPYFEAQVLDASGAKITCLDYNIHCTNGTPPAGFQTSNTTAAQALSDPVYYKGWTTLSFNLKPYIGTTVTLQFIAAGCIYDVHFGYAYIDCSCGQVYPTIVPTCTNATLTGPPGDSLYAWSGPSIVGPSNGQSVVVNQSGTYTLDVTISKGCTYTLDTTVTINPSLTVTTTPNNIACFGEKGNITSNVTGGNPGYTYSWNNGETGAKDSLLPAGTYTLTVKDLSGCTQTSTATITGPTKLTATLSTTPSNCSSNNGSATVAVSNGSPAYTYSWNTGQTTSAITNVAAGTYSVTITDTHSCSIDTVVTVPSTGATITPTITATNILCNGAANGTASLTGISGGTPGYTYSWSNGITGTNITGLSAGAYTITAKDANGCIGTATIAVTEPTAINPVVATTNVLCNGGNGSITTAGTSGGTPGYTYSWTNGATTSAITAGAGSYTVTITDNNSCTVTANSTITQPAVITETSSITPPTCGSSNGSAGLVTVSGGTPGYTYKWSSGQTTSTISGIAVGNFTVTITDANNCTQPVPIVVPNSNGPRDSITNTVNEKCFGQTIGSATVGVANGTPGYTYAWTPSGGTNATASNLAAGVYTVTVQDAAGCSTSAIDTIKQPTQLLLSGASFPVSCNGECNGQLLSIPSGGTKPYIYSWSNGATSTSQLNVCAGTYSVVVTDANGCVVDSTGLVVSQPTPVTGAVTPVTATCGLPNGSACVNGGSAGGGTPGYTYAWSNGATTTCINNVLPTNYTLIITDANKCKDTVNFIVPSLPGDTAIITGITDVLCFGGNNGSAVGGGKGGTQPYSYSWSPTSQTTQTASNLIAGNYTLTVTDKIGCTSTVTVTITQPALVVATPSGPQVICIGQSATLSVSAIGGTPGYTYNWMPGNLTGPSVSVSPSKTTTYTITTVDANNCPSLPVYVTVTVNPPLTISISPNKATCPGGSLSFTATVKGGDGIYTYSWVPPAGLNDTNTATVTSTPGTTTEYTVTVHDACGDVPVIDSVKAIVDPIPVVNFIADTLNGCTPLCIRFNDTSTIAASGNISSWSWTFGDGGASVAKDTMYCYQNAGVYTVGLIVTSDSGCVDSLIIPNMITAYSHPVAKFSASPQPTTIMNPTIYFKDESTDAYGIKTWFWEFKDQTDNTSSIENPQHTFIDTGRYCPELTVVNIHNCVDSTEECIEISPFFTIYIPNAFSPNGDGLNDVFTAKGTYICSFGMYIFDRWGMMLYNTNDINQGWDGTVNGGTNIAQEDTYVYLIEAVDCVEHKKHRFVGRVSIVK